MTQDLENGSAEESLSSTQSVVEVGHPVYRQPVTQGRDLQGKPISQDGSFQTDQPKDKDATPVGYVKPITVQGTKVKI